MRYINCCACAVCLLIFVGIKFRWDQIFIDFFGFLIHYEGLYLWCVINNVCSAWFLVIKICINLL